MIPNFAEDASYNSSHAQAKAKKDGIAGDKDFDIMVLDATSEAVLKVLRRVRAFTDGTSCTVRPFGFQCGLPKEADSSPTNSKRGLWVDFWMYGRINFDGLDELAADPSRQPSEKWKGGGKPGQYATLEQAMGITDRSAYVCLGHLNRPGDKQNSAVNFDKTKSEMHVPWSKRTTGALRNGVHEPLGTCTEYFNVYYAVDSRRWRWGWLGVQRTDLGNENMFSTPVIPASIVLPLAYLPFSSKYQNRQVQGENAQPWDGHVFPVPGQIDLYLELRYGTTWNTACGGYRIGTTPCSDFHKTSLFVIGSSTRNNSSAQLSLQIGERELYTFRFDPPRASKRLLQQLNPVGRVQSCCRRFKW